MSDSPAALVNILITPAQAHDNKYPKQLPNFGHVEQQQPSKPTVSPYFDRVLWQNDAKNGGTMQLPKDGHHIVADNPLEAVISNIEFNLSNFNPATGLCVFSFLTDANYQMDPIATVGFGLNKDPASFDDGFIPNTKFTYVLGLSKHEVSGFRIVVISKQIKPIGSQ